MPLSTVCIASGGPRAWLASSTIPSNDYEDYPNMNNAEDIKTCKTPSFHSSSLQRRTLSCTYDLPEKPAKKEKKWSITNIFRRKKKEDSDSTSGDEIQKRGFLGRRRKRETKRKKSSLRFDHVVMPSASRDSRGHNEDAAVMSDPTASFSNYLDRSLPVTQKKLTRSNLNELSNCSIQSGSLESIRKNKRELTKARAEARRNSSINGTSSEEESEISSRLAPASDMQLHRKSRAARTERYLKRHSQDGENPHNYLRVSKSDVENSLTNWKYLDIGNRSQSRSPITFRPHTPTEPKYKVSLSSLNSRGSNVSGLSIPPNNVTYSKYSSINNPPKLINNTPTKCDALAANCRSVSCDENINKTPTTEFGSQVLHVQFPVVRSKRGYRNLSLIDTSHLNHARHPPPPPPRDPNRAIGTNYFDNTRPSTFYFDNTGETKSKSLGHSNAYQREQECRKNAYNFHPNCRSTSENHLAQNTSNARVHSRALSTTELNQPKKIISNSPKTVQDEFNYFTDKKPRSRKPIFIQSGSKLTNDNNKKDANSSHNAAHFWKEIDRQISLNQTASNRTPSKSPQMFSSHAHVQSTIFLPNRDQNEGQVLNINSHTDQTPCNVTSPLSDKATKEEIKRKSSNLEEALHELESIYNSLRLGDEDLLERAEQKEKEIQAQKFHQSTLNTYPSGSIKGTLSDTNFSYEPFDTVDSSRNKRLPKKSYTVDLKLDDMAFRKLNKGRANTIGDPQSVVSQISYLMRSPVFGRNREDQNPSDEANNEADVTLDDVVYRNIKHSNNLLKVAEPQLPFGIPMGPITPGANSDYLHAKPENIYKPTFHHRKIPDIVKDDLAFRNLRKDSNKGPALPLLSNEDFSNHNFEANCKYLKKKTLQRSMSQNIADILTSNRFNISDDPVRNDLEDRDNSFKTLTDIADAMEIARNVLKEKENKISATRKAFLSDTDATFHSTRNKKESKINFLNELRHSPHNKNTRVKSTSPNLLLKPPRGLTPERLRSPKEFTPLSVSPLEPRFTRGESTSSSLDDLLNAVTEEAKKTSERIRKELNQLEDSSLNKESLLQVPDSNVENEIWSDIKTVSQHPRQHSSLVDSAGFINELDNSDEEVQSIIHTPAVTESATVVMSRFDGPDEDVFKTNESEHDYENLISDNDEANVSSKKRKITVTVALLQESAPDLGEPIILTTDASDSADVHTHVEPSPVNTDLIHLDSDRSGDEATDNGPQLTTWIKLLSQNKLNMFNNQESRLDRINRYKDERRKQLYEQSFSNRSKSEISDNCKDIGRTNNGITADTAKDSGTTKTYKLRTTVYLQENVASQIHADNTSKSDNSTTYGGSETEVKAVGSKRIERDKSNKRKSNLNRSLNSEQVASTEGNRPIDTKDRRQRRRFFPNEIFESSPPHSGRDTEQRDLNESASISSLFATSHTASVALKQTQKKSELSIHMENARKSVTSPNVDVAKYKPFAKRFNTPSPKQSTTKLNVDKVQSSDEVSSSPDKYKSVLSYKEKTKEIESRMQGLSALTKQTLARVERLTNKDKEMQKKEPHRTTGINHIDRKKNVRGLKKPMEKALLSSILKKKSLEEPSVILDQANLPAVSSQIGPVSILKRKVSQDDNRSEGSAHLSTQSPPVTFSPSVLDSKTSSRRKQGILKKRRSLDESTVLRHRSCSPDVANKTDSRSILKNQRRSSLEELGRIESPEIHLQSILKRRTSKYDDDDQSLNSPQGILKRRSGASSASSTGSSPHVSITTAVILAAAGGAEMILDSDGEAVRPILKKTSFSEECFSQTEASSDGPKPILKKKSSTDTDDSEEKPKPILKFPRSSLEGETLEYSLASSSETECEVKPILKQISTKEDSSRSRRSLCTDSSNFKHNSRDWSSRRSHTICSDFNIDVTKLDNKDDPVMTKQRPFSVYDLVMSFEQSCSTGAIPKLNRHKRNSSRYKTQPVTNNELESSLHLLKNPQSLTNPNCNNRTSSSLIPTLAFTSSLEGGKRSFSHVKSSSFSYSEKNEDQKEPEMAQIAEKQEVPIDQIDNFARNLKLFKDIGKRDQLDNRRTNKTLDDSSINMSSGAISSSSKPISNEHNHSDTQTDQSHNINIEPSFDKDDEGISCNDSSSSDSEFSSTNMKASDEWNLNKTQGIFSGDSTSEGESSGGREVQKIFNSDSRLKIKGTVVTAVSRSKSQDSIGNGSDLQSNRCHTPDDMPQAIADLRAKLQERGESDWKKRVSLYNPSDELKLLKEKNKYNDEISDKSLLSAKKVELDAASRQWKSRVTKSDAEKFSIAGKMGEKVKLNVPTINIPVINDTNKKVPRAKRFRLKEGNGSTPNSPEKNDSISLTRSKSLSYHSSFDYRVKGSDTSKVSKKSVCVPNPDDITMKIFFESSKQTAYAEQIDCSLEDFNAIPRQPLLALKKNIQVQKRRGASKNHIKVLASRTDISNEYTEILTGVAEREKKRLTIEKLAKNSDKALEALAGLASIEDFKSVALKKASLGSLGQVPWKDVMLLQVKGRRHVQTRLVEPIADSINEGDNYILITSNSLYTYIGAFSNVIEQSRVSDVANHIKKSGDLGCKVDSVVTISAEDKASTFAREFWKILGTDQVPDTIGAGHPDEDGTYESHILHTNMIYTLDKDELIPYDKYWGSIPKVEMLTDTSIIVFDFGSEMYVWSGKNASLEKKRLAFKLAQEIWDEGYNYSDCNICPLNIASILGARPQEKLPLVSNKRPKWALFAKLTHHRETILFKEKFLDWPDFSRTIRIKVEEETHRVNSSIDIQQCDVEDMLKEKDKNPDLIVENTHLGRGDEYYDEDTYRLFSYETLNVTGWRILEYTYEKLPDRSLGQFYDTESYIFRWDFTQTVRGKKLSGNPSKYGGVGRDRCIFFCWQGSKSSINEKGAAALLTVELDKENAPQIRITQGSEPAAFLQLFKGNMVVHRGRRNRRENKPRLFIVLGEKQNEIHLIEVGVAMSSLRSRASFLLFDELNERIIIWCGSKSNELNRRIVKRALDNLLKNKPFEMHLDKFEDFNIVEALEGSEAEDILDILGSDRKSYHSLLNSDKSYDYTVRLFLMCSLTGQFVATEIQCPYRSDHHCPYPFMQTDLYSASQPALFLIDNDSELWLWQGKYPEQKTDGDQIGSGPVRWQAERRAAMQTAVAYWEKKFQDEPLVAYIVSAGLEPIEFKNLFPVWDSSMSNIETNIQVGKEEGEKCILKDELALLSRTTYSLTELLNRPLPDGVDPTSIEKYLSSEDFQQLLLMTKEEFDRLPSWKKTAIKKQKGLF